MNAFKSEHFRVEEVAEGAFAAIHIDGGAAIGNAGFVDLGDRVLVFDTFISPIPAVDLRRAAETMIGKPIGEVVNSHYHNDHIRGNQIFKDREIVASEETLRLIETEGRKDLAWNQEEGPAFYAKFDEDLKFITDPVERRTVEFGRHYYRVIAEGLEEFEWVAPSRSFKGSLELEGSKRRVELRSYAGGHTGDDAILLLPDDGVAFLSDLFFIDNHPYLADGNPLTWLEHLEALEGLKEKVLVPGHGPVGGQTDLSVLANYIRGTMDAVKAAIDEGRNADDVIAEGIPAPYTNWDLPTFYGSNVRFLFEYLGK
jgi:glyoxylase-like metal-dependent hydrolase (beta-lactamase superfamily II)